MTYDPLIELMKRFENVRADDSRADPFEGLSIEDALKKHILDGIRKNLEEHLEIALQTYKPLDIINNILLDGMKTVGDLFGTGKMQLPFVLQSAETMKAAVRILEPKMEKSDTSERGSILLATVAGDVHDIGKNLVDIILSNNGYRTVNIGIKQPIQAIVDKAQEHNVDVIGMSGLLVKSTLVMKENLIEMNERGLSHYPVILGGAALTRGYVEQDLREIYQGRVYYAQDAFEGLSLMETILASKDEQPQKRFATPTPRPGVVDAHLYVFDGVKSDVRQDIEPPKLPFYGAKSKTDIDIRTVYNYINTVALWRGQWQFRRPDDMPNPEFVKWLEAHAGPIFERMKRELSPIMQPKVKWGYFWCRSDGNDLVILHEDAKTERLRFRFPRQSDHRRLCLADFFRSDVPDVVAFHIVTVGPEVSRRERELFEKGDYRDYLYTHGMGVETAEALAEYWHQQVRKELGIDDMEPEGIRPLFAARYHGCRFSFGYPACPNLEDQRLIFELLNPEEIGIELTEEFMLAPEQSTSALIAHHPEARYFNVK